MSRIGKKPVAIPGGVTAAVNGQEVKVKGPKGELQHVLVDDIIVKLDNSEIEISMREDTQRARAMWGMSRTMVANLIAGVTGGFTKKLEMTGVGYRASVQGHNVQLQLGYSHDIIFPIPQGIQVVCPKPTEIVVTGIDKQKVGQVAAPTLDKDRKGALPKGSDLAAAQAVGKLVAERALKAGVKDVVFDRGGYLFHGRVKALADAAREAGLNF